MLINQLFNNYKFAKQFTLMPAFFFVTMTSVPWYYQEMNGELLLIFPLLVLLNYLIEFSIEEKRNWETLFLFGLFSGICISIKYQSFFVIIAFLISFLFLNPVRIANLVTMLGGFLLYGLILFLILFYKGSLSAFWDIGFVFNADYIRLGKHPGEDSSWLSAFEIVKFWGVVMVLAVFGFLAMRVQYFKMVIRQRKIESIFRFWLFLSIPIVLLGGKRFYPHYFILAAPPLIFYAVYFLKNNIKPILQAPTLLLGFGFATGVHCIYFACVSPFLFSTIQPQIKPNGWVIGLHNELNPSTDEQLLLADIQSKNISKGILITQYEPELYMKMEQHCASKYTNFSIAYFKMDWLPQNRMSGTLISKRETIPNVYRTFQKEMPDYIIDRLDIFPEIQDVIPLLLTNYERKQIGIYTVYSHKNQ